MTFVAASNIIKSVPNPPHIASAPMDEDPRATETIVEVYTDGACPSNGKDGAVAGIGVFFGQDDFRNVMRAIDFSEYGGITNNIAELAAVDAALQAIIDYEFEMVSTGCRGDDRLYFVYSDSRYVLDVINIYGALWAVRNWTKIDGKPVKNLGLVRSVLFKARALEKIGVAVEYRHVAAHCGIFGNEAANAFAQAAVGTHPEFARIHPVHGSLSYVR